jgi:DNA mismatch endonuclease (patch repair protein)
VTDKLNSDRRSENMRRIRSRDTSPEISVRRIVHGMGFRYRLHVAALPGKPDMVLTRLKKIIEIRGCFWHQHGVCIDSHMPKSRRDYWRPKLERNKSRDYENLCRLKALGFRVLVLWECEVRSDKHLTAKIKRFLTSAPKDTPPTRTL